MKNFIYLVLLSILFSCNKQESPISEQESKISLVSPKGVSVSNSISDLKTTIRENAELAFGKRDFIIEKITFTETDLQVASFVEFRSTSNEYGSVLLLQGLVKGNKNARTNSVMVANTVVVDCSGGCDSAGETCRERVIFNGGNMSYECTCQGSCKMTITEK